jgi:hypothetical protein
MLVLLSAASIALAGHARAAAVGAVLGIGREGISGDTPPSTSYGGATGLVAGLQAEIGLTEGIALSVQPMFSQRRTTLTTATFNGETTRDLKLDYVSVPVVLKFRTSGRTYVAGGATVGLLQNAHLSGDGADEDIEDDFERVDLGALFGFGVMFPIGRPHLTTELRYVQGLANLSNESETDPALSLPDRFHSGGWQVTAGILFPLGRP